MPNDFYERLKSQGGPTVGDTQQGAGDLSSILLNQPGQQVPDRPSPTIPDQAYEDFVRRIPDALNMGLTGAQVGGMPGAAVGGIVGLFMPPSEQPLTDLGATVGELIANRFLPGSGKLARFLKGVTGVPTGASIGQWGDKKADFVGETRWGPIALYSGLAGVGYGLQAALPRQGTNALAAADNLRENFGVDIFLGFRETTGKGEGLERFFTRGSQAEKNLAKQQNERIIEVANKIVEGSTTNPREIVEQGLEARQYGKQSMQLFRERSERTAAREALQAGKKFNPEDVKLDWDSFARRYGFTPEEKDIFFKTIRRDPELFIDQFVPADAASMKGAIKLRAIRKMLQIEDPTGEVMGKFGTAIVTRAIGKTLRSSPEIGRQLQSGTFLRTALDKLGDDFLVTALGPERAQALRDLAEVTAMADVNRKLFAGEQSQKERVINYIGNKFTFAALAGGAAGATLGAPIGVVPSALAGGTVMFSLNTAINMIMTSPVMGKVILAAANGNPTAYDALIRTLMSDALGGEHSKEIPEDQSVSGPLGIAGPYSLPSLFR